jgi:hypothetical protein
MFVVWAWSGWMLSVMYYWRGFGVVPGWCVVCVGDPLCMFVWGHVGMGKGEWKRWKGRGLMVENKGRIIT